MDGGLAATQLINIYHPHLIPHLQGQALQYLESWCLNVMQATSPTQAGSQMCDIKNNKC
jgi:hypothetical protein